VRATLFSIQALRIWLYAMVALAMALSRGRWHLVFTGRVLALLDQGYFAPAMVPRAAVVRRMVLFLLSGATLFRLCRGGVRTDVVVGHGIGILRCQLRGWLCGAPRRGTSGDGLEDAAGSSPRAGGHSGYANL